MSDKWAIDANAIGLRHTQVSKRVCEVIYLKEF